MPLGPVALDRRLCDTAAMFSPAVLDHFKNPRNAGELPGATTVVEVANPVCGDILRLAVRVEEGRIAEARFQTRGCVTSIACSSLLTELLTGRSLAEAGEITAELIDERLGGLELATRHGAELARDAVEALLAQAR
jgi:nitrogen fixation NifU-like protein